MWKKTDYSFTEYIFVKRFFWIIDKLDKKWLIFYFIMMILSVNFLWSFSRGKKRSQSIFSSQLSRISWHELFINTKILKIIISPLLHPQPQLPRSMNPSFLKLLQSCSILTWSNRSIIIARLHALKFLHGLEWSIGFLFGMSRWRSISILGRRSDQILIVFWRIQKTSPLTQKRTGTSGPSILFIWSLEIRRWTCSLHSYTWNRCRRRWVLTGALLVCK